MVEHGQIMRIGLAVLLCSLAACSGGESDEPPPLPDECTRACTADDADCASYPYEMLPSRCQDICFLGRCCALTEDNTWNVTVYDCAMPTSLEAESAGE